MGRCGGGRGGCTAPTLQRSGVFDFTHSIVREGDMPTAKQRLLQNECGQEGSAELLEQARWRGGGGRGGTDSTSACFGPLALC
jgi:hypothetical protein